MQLVDEDAVRATQRIGRTGSRLERGMDHGSRERHQQRGCDPLPGHVGDDHPQRAAAPPQSEQLEEVAADVPGGGIVTGQLVARDLGCDE